MTALLAARGVSAGYGEVGVLREVSLDVEARSITALVGSNGAGKTTLMRVFAGLLPLDAGSLVFDGADIGRTPAHRRVERGVSLVPEGRLVFPDFTVEENLRIGAVAPRARDRLGETREAMYALFPRLRERRGQAAGTLSGGEQQMLALARGLMSRPRLLLLDEPSLGLAPGAVDLLFASILRIRGDGVTVFVVEQNVRATLEIADAAYVIENGRIVLRGSGASLLDEPMVKTAYLGL